MADSSCHIPEGGALALGDRPRARSPPLRRVLTRVLFLACFGVGDFSVLQGRHALASPRPPVADANESRPGVPSAGLRPELMTAARP